MTGRIWYTIKKSNQLFYKKFNLNCWKYLSKQDKELYKMHLKWAAMLEDGLLGLRRFRSGPWEHAHQFANFILVRLSVWLTDCLSVRESWSRPDCSCPATLWVFALITLAQREVSLTLVSYSNFHSVFLRVLLHLCWYWFTSMLPSRLINNTYYTVASPKPFYYTSVIHHLQLSCLYKNLRLQKPTFVKQEFIDYLLYLRGRMWHLILAFWECTLLFTLVY